MVLGANFRPVRSVTALNHGSYGAASLPTIAMERRWMSEAQQNTLEWFSYKVRPILRDIRANLAAYLSVRTTNSSQQTRRSAQTSWSALGADVHGRVCRECITRN